MLEIYHLRPHLRLIKLNLNFNKILSETLPLTVREALVSATYKVGRAQKGHEGSAVGAAGGSVVENTGGSSASSSSEQKNQNI